VATDVGGIPEMVGDDGALLVPAGDPAALARAVAGVLDDGDRAGRLAAAALRRAAGLPTDGDAIDQVAGRYLRLTGFAATRAGGHGGGVSTPA
jgi:glycosyltransferase involved in cell wall biosynthesis